MTLHLQATAGVSMITSDNKTVDIRPQKDVSQKLFLDILPRCRYKVPINFDSTYSSNDELEDLEHVQHQIGYKRDEDKRRFRNKKTDRNWDFARTMSPQRSSNTTSPEMKPSTPPPEEAESSVFALNMGDDQTSSPLHSRISCEQIDRISKGRAMDLLFKHGLLITTSDQYAVIMNLSDRVVRLPTGFRLFGNFS